MYLDRGSLSTWVSKYGILHKTQLAWFDNATSLSKPGGSCLLKQASSVSLVRSDTRFWGLLHRAARNRSQERARRLAGPRRQISPAQRASRSAL